MDKVAKAVVAALVAFGVVFDVATSDGSLAGEVVVSTEWVRIVVASVVAGLAVWATPNAPIPPKA